MKLIIIRHCEAAAADGSDHERPLTTLGNAQAQALGKRLAAAGLVMDGCICSDALRTKMTWSGVVQGMSHGAEGLAIPVRFTRGLYNGSVGDIRAQLTAHGHGSVMAVVGHNPGFSRAVEQLCGASVQLSVGHAVLLQAPEGPWSEKVWSDWSLVQRFHGDG